MKRRGRFERGVTLLELMIAVTLLSVLSLGMFMAMRLGISALTRTDDKLMTNRRVAGAQRILMEELEGLMPVMGICGAAPNGASGGTPDRLPFFQGEAGVMRLVSTYSLQESWRGRPQILEMAVIPGESAGVRLVVNEIQYGGPSSTGRICTVRPGGGLPQFTPVQVGPTSFVLADKLAYCRFWYLTPGARANDPNVWQPAWRKQAWPLGVRVEMAPLEANASQVQTMTVTAPIYVHRSPEIQYGDF